MSRLTYPFKPDFMPVGIDTSRTKQPVGAETTTTCNVVENYAVIGKTNHPTAFLINDLLDPAKNSERTAAVRRHLDVERESTIAVVLVEGPHDLIF